MTRPDPLSLLGQNAIVTGSSSGIGRSIAVELARAGADVLVNYHSDEDGGAETVRTIEALGRRAFNLRADVGKEGDVTALFDTAERELGPVDIVVSNAGLQKDARLTDMTLDEWNIVIDTNLTGAFLMAREAVRRFRAKGMRDDVSRSLGKILFNSSVHERIPWAFHVNYAASKGGIKLLMESVAQEVSSEKIRVNSVAPGAIATAINAAEREAGEAEMLKLIPYGRVGDPDDVGRVAAFLVSDAADYIVGQTLFVDGAMTLYPEFKGNG